MRDDQQSAGHRRGTLLGDRYRLGELLGVGGSASVFAADDLGPGAEGASEGTRVAVKILHPHLCADEASRQAFLREARQFAGLRHPNIAAVHGYGLHEAGGVTMAWIALELVDGPSLAELVADAGPLPVGQAAAVLDGLLAGLQLAHSAGTVHRDISPANVLLRRGTEAQAPVSADQVRLVDFGLAGLAGTAATGRDVLRTEQEGGTGGGAAAGSSAREVEGVIGNAHYMSPEQALGEPVRASGDVYQCGAVLYFLLTGRPPYPRTSAANVLEAHVSAPPPVPSVLAPSARALDAVVTRAMTKEASNRYRDAAEFRLALRAALAVADRPRPGALPPQAAPGEAVATRIHPSARPAALHYLTPTPAQGGRPPAREPSLQQTATASGIAALLTVVAIAGLAVWGVVSASAEPGSVASVTSTPMSSQPTEAAVPPPSTPAAEPGAPTGPAGVAPPSASTAATVAVPTLHGSLGDAETALRAAGLTLGAANRAESAEEADRLLAQSPQPGEVVAVGSVVDVTVASGTNSVPAVQGASVGAAVALLESAGFRVDPVGSSSPSATVLGTQPGQGAVLRVGVTVALLLADPPSSTPTPAPTSATAPPTAGARP